MKKSKSLIGGEQSGHIIMSKFSNSGDGILAALKIIEIMNISKIKSSKIFNLYKEYSQEKINLVYKSKNKKLTKIIDDLNNNKTLNNSKIRSLIRLSGTEPIVRILVEGENKKLVKENSIKIKNIVRPYLV